MHRKPARADMQAAVVAVVVAEVHAEHRLVFVVLPAGTPFSVAKRPIDVPRSFAQMPNYSLKRGLAPAGGILVLGNVHGSFPWFVSGTIRIARTLGLNPTPHPLVRHELVVLDLQPPDLHAQREQGADDRDAGVAQFTQHEQAAVHLAVELGQAGRCDSDFDHVTLAAIQLWPSRPQHRRRTPSSPRHSTRRSPPLASR